MWPFKKIPPTPKKPEEPPKKVKVIEYRREKKELGKTVVKITFADGRKINTMMYGGFYQPRAEYERDGRTPKILMDSHSITSLHEAQIYLKMIDGSRASTVVDDGKNPGKAVTGIIVKAEIGQTFPYEEEVEVAYVVEKEV